MKSIKGFSPEAVRDRSLQVRRELDAAARSKQAKRTLDAASAQKQQTSLKEFSELRQALGEHNEITHANMPPNILVLRRKTVRQFPGGLMVALYYNDKLHQYFSIPYGSPQDSDDQVITPTSLKESEMIHERVVSTPQLIKLYRQHLSNPKDKAAHSAYRKAYKQHAAHHEKLADNMNLAKGWEKVEESSQDVLNELSGETLRAVLRAGKTLRTYRDKRGEQDGKSKSTHFLGLGKAGKKSVSEESEQLDEISIPLATAAMRERTKRGKEAIKKGDYRSATQHLKKATKTLDRRSEKYRREDRGEVVQEGRRRETREEATARFERERKDFIKKDKEERRIAALPKKINQAPLKEEELSEDAISHLQRVKEFHTNLPLKHKDGTQTQVDPTTAHALLTVHQALHPDNRKKYADALEHSKSKFHKMLDFAWSNVK